MPGSFASVFGVSDDLAAALRGEGCRSLLVTGKGAFRARLTQIALDRLRLTAGEEELARIAFFAIPAEDVLVCFSLGGTSAIWGGIEMRAGDIITIGAGERVHARTTGACRWVVVRVPERDLAQCARALTGQHFAIPRGLARWRPPPIGRRHLQQLSRAAIRGAEAQSGAFADPQAVHGLEQQLLQALVECLCQEPAQAESAIARRQRKVLARFEDALEDAPARRVTEICAALGTPERLLRACCKSGLEMSPSRYRRCRALQQANRTLRDSNPNTTTIAEVAGRCGFRASGRFAGTYRAVYGELPSATLRRHLPGSGVRRTGGAWMKLS